MLRVVHWRLIALSLGLTVCGMPAGVAGADDGAAHELRYRFAPEEVTHFRVNHHTVFTTQKDTLVESAKNDSLTYKHYRVVSVNEDGTATLELQIDRVRMMVQFDEGEPLAMDSARPAEECPSKYKDVLKTIGLPLARITVSPRGELVKVEKTLPSALQLGITPGESDDTPDDDPGKNPLLLLPENAVRVGDTWNDELQVHINVSRTLRQPVKLRRKYTLESVEGDIAHISMKTIVLTPVRDPQLQAQLIQRTPAGTLDFDMATGKIVSRTATINETLIGPLGGSSSMRAVSERTENVITPAEAAEQTAAAEAPTKK